MLSDYTDQVRDDTSAFLESNAGLQARTSSLLMAYHELADLYPGTVSKVFAGSFFPLAESITELSHAYLLARRGLYRHAMTGLRNVLELGLLSVFWDRFDHAEDEIGEWLKGKEHTPFMDVIKKGLLEIKPVKVFEQKFQLIDLLSRTYNDELGKFVHIRGVRYSYGGMNGGNVLRFNEFALHGWVNSLETVVRLVIIVHLLKYPIGLQYTPIEQKYGFFGPTGGFLNPDQVHRVTRVLTDEHLAELQKISDADEEAVTIARSIQEMPDISNIELEEQFVRFKEML